MSTWSTMEFPEFPTWLNAKPLVLQEHRGCALILAFINASSVWSTQRLAELERWRSRNPGYVRTVVIQVPRFDNEREPARALKLLRSQGFSVPILLDRDWEAWRHFGIESWPTLVLIDAQGRERQRLVGVEDDLEQALLALCDGQAALTNAALYDPPELDPEITRPLNFPQGIASSADRLYVADSGHHRILECTHRGRVLRQFGSGNSGLVDGVLAKASFSRPRGLSLGHNALFVADTGNHALRRIDLRDGRVDTLCGNGIAGSPSDGVVGRPSSMPLDYPQDVAITGNHVVIATAGDNRIWRYDLGNSEMRCVAGTGELDSCDGHRTQASFAQPSSVVAVHQMLYVCDALSSTVRSVQLFGDQVRTLANGQGVWGTKELGNVQGQGGLQCPQAIAIDAGATQVMWIADTGNGRLCRLDIRGQKMVGVDLLRRLSAPSALAVTPGAVWIAETDAHAVSCYDLAAGGISEVPIAE